MDGSSWFQIAIHYQVADAIFQIVLYGTLQWAGAKLYIITFSGHKLFSFIAQVYVVANLLYTLVQTFSAQRR